MPVSRTACPSVLQCAVNSKLASHDSVLFPRPDSCLVAHTTGNDIVTFPATILRIFRPRCRGGACAPPGSGGGTQAAIPQPAAAACNHDHRLSPGSPEPRPGTRPRVRILSCIPRRVRRAVSASPRCSAAAAPRSRGGFKAFACGTSS